MGDNSFANNKLLRLHQVPGQTLTTSNTLTVNNSQYAAPRKSLIGRLERSSFQAQRLSDVGVAVGQQITAKMGLKLPASQERIVEQTRWLYLRYIFVKLRQNKLPLRDLNLTKSSRARRAAALAAIAAPGLSHSAPATAGVVLTEPEDAQPFSNHSSPKLPYANGRRRVTLNQNIDTQDLTLLASKMRNSDLKYKDASNDNLSTISDSSTSNMNTGISNSYSAQTTIRKSVMDPTINNQIFAVIVNIIRELRDWKPDYYGDTIYELIGIDKFSSIDSLLDAQMTICQEMTRSEISWCRIVALFSLFGAMSLDCVRLGAPEHVGPILDGFIGFVERDLAFWISQQGGWESFLYRYQAGFPLEPLISKALAVALPFFIWAVLRTFNWGGTQ